MPRSLENIARASVVDVEKKNWARGARASIVFRLVEGLGGAFHAFLLLLLLAFLDGALVRVLVAAKVVVELRVVLFLVGLFWHPFSKAGETARVVVQVRVQHLVADHAARLWPVFLLAAAGSAGAGLLSVNFSGRTVVLLKANGRVGRGRPLVARAPNQDDDQDAEENGR